MSQLSRRSLLVGLGVSAALVPLLSVRGVRAAPAKAPPRFIVVMMPNGFQDDFLPKGGETDFQISTADDSPMKPLIPHRDRLIVMGGIDLRNGQETNKSGLGGHAALPFVLTGAKGSPGPEISDGLKWSAGGPSLDRYLAKNLPGNASSPFDSLVVRACRLNGNDQYLSFDGPCLDGKTPNAPTPRDDPQELFDSVFGKDLGKDQLTRMRAERASVLDFSRQGLKTLLGRVGSADKMRIEQHIAATESLEKQLASAGGTACTPPIRLPDLKDGTNYTKEPANPNIPAIVKSEIDIIVSAMHCGQTRVASLALTNSNNNLYTFTWLKDKHPAFGETIGDKDSGGFNAPGMLWHHHAIAHNEGGMKQVKNYVDQWFLGQLAYLLDQLTVRKDPDGSPMIENTVVLLVNLQRSGGGHETNDIKWILAGNANGALKTGRYLRWLGGSPGKGVPQNGVLAAIVNAMGCTPVTFFGDPAYGGPATTLLA